MLTAMVWLGVATWEFHVVRPAEDTLHAWDNRAGSLSLLALAVLATCWLNGGA